MAKHPTQYMLGLPLKRILSVLALAAILLPATVLHADIATVSEQRVFSSGATVLPSALHPACSASLAEELANAAPGADSGKSGAAATSVANQASSFDVRLFAGPLAAGPASPLVPVSVGDTRDSAKPDVKELPPPPGSLTAALSSLLTLGGWRLIRQSKQIHLGSLPEWYHGGAGQVCHATPLDLGAHVSLLPVCWYQPGNMVIEDSPTMYFDQPEHHSCRRSSCFTPTIAPRSPPTFA
jgi:hypothetical protein